MSCLFDSLSKFIPVVNSYQLRNLICDFLAKNEKLTDDLTSEDVVKFESNVPLDQYVSSMRQTSTMGGATEIKAFCVLFRKNVKVESVPNNKTIEFIANQDYPFLYLRWTGGHYDPIMYIE
jgi:hypothetical protein